MCNNNSLVELKDWFILKDKSDWSYNFTSKNQLLKNGERKYSYFSDLTFKKLVALIVNKFTCLNIYFKLNRYKTDLLNNINFKFFKLFKKFYQIESFIF